MGTDNQFTSGEPGRPPGRGGEDRLLLLVNDVTAAMFLLVAVVFAGLVRSGAVTGWLYALAACVSAAALAQAAAGHRYGPRSDQAALATEILYVAACVEMAVEIVADVVDGHPPIIPTMGLAVLAMVTFGPTNRDRRRQARRLLGNKSRAARAKLLARQHAASR